MQLRPFLLLATLCGCATASPTPPSEPPTTATATAVIEARSGSSVGGTVTFEEVAGTEDAMGVRALRVRIDLTGLAPGEHGFHVHANGDCSDPKADSAGPHFDVAGHPHAGLAAEASHAGDLGNVTADADGHVVAVVEPVRKLTLVPGGATSVLGRAVVVHDKVDDLVTQPSGAAGPRVGCGVVGALTKLPPR